MSKNSVAGVHYTNHSLRATAIARMFNSSVHKKIIAEKSGHKNIEVLRGYENPSTELEKVAGDVIADHTKDFSADTKPVLTKPKIPKADVPEFSELCLIVLSMSILGRQQVICDSLVCYLVHSLY